MIAVHNVENNLYAKQNNTYKRKRKPEVLFCDVFEKCYDASDACTMKSDINSGSRLHNVSSFYNSKKED